MRRTLRSIANRLAELSFNPTAKRVEELGFAKSLQIANAMQRSCHEENIRFSLNK